MSYLKFSFLLLAVLAISPYGQAALPNLVQNPRFITGPTGEPNSFAANWFYYSTATTTSAVTTRLAPGVSFKSISGPLGTSTTDRGVSQVIPNIVPGATYQVNASWRGYFNSSAATFAGNNSGAAARVYVAFGPSSIGPWTEQHLLYKKFGYDRVIDSWNVPATLFSETGGVDASSYDWSAWEDAYLSPTTNHPFAQDIALAPAGSTHMRLRLNFTTTAQPLTTVPGDSWVEFDNVSVTACQAAIAGDVNNDCKVTFADFAIQAANWLVCGMTPSSFCP